MELPRAEIKKEPEDFIVEEILPNGHVLNVDTVYSHDEGRKDGKFVHFIMQKRDWDTNSAIKRIARALRISHKRFNHAGTKDKFAITTQRVSCFACDKDKLLNLKLKDIKILGAWYENDKVRLGELAGNRFKIRIYTENNADGVKPLNMFFNFFGPQRFGTTRRNTHLIGKNMLLSDYKSAVLSYLLDSNSEHSETAKDARKRLKDDLDFKKALIYFPKYLRYERILLSHLAEHPTDYIGALRRFPRSTVLMFIHAYQSYLFNMELCYMITHNFDLSYNTKLNIIGYETEVNDIEKMILKKEGLTKEMFMLKSMPELSAKGNFRNAIEVVDEPQFKDNIFIFSLRPGAYASTYLLHHFTIDSLPLPPGFSRQCMQESIKKLSDLSF
ncbi:tRNA pseudouridine(13) synthase TruD [Candidatus Micrarchaeota archaeon]|nr:tRNA pseudouridine(13) synthase TruD [Candidatus Micrarchaeota archaeon]